MFLTKFQMNPQRRESVRLVGSPQRMHAAVLSTLPPEVSRESGGRMLWRLDAPSKFEWNLYVVSPARPSFEVLQECCGWSQSESWKTADYAPFLAALLPGQRWRFRLTANPVRAQSNGRGRRGVVIPHVTADHQRDWLLKRAERHGFTVPMGEQGPLLDVSRRQQESFTKGEQGSKQRATITRVQFDGILEVSDPRVLSVAMLNGIGRAKAYGCGLLTLAKLTQ